MSYEMVCGIETHIELSTATKIFCGCSTAFGGAPNTHCCPICTGQPGALPTLNEKVVEYAITAGLATNCKINAVTHLDRKNYCYPDLPKAYQISQYDKPLCEHGYIALDSGKKIGITRIHIEEDAGKLMHEGGFTFIDYNRGGVPLIEIVSEPDISSPEEAREYAEKLRLIMRAVGVSDCRMQEGSMRCDVNISLKEKGSGAFGTRTEIKNMNSLSHMVKALEYEYSRQEDILKSGGKVEQATLRFDERTGETYVMRTKEDAQDYRYFPEPDLLTVVIPQEKIDSLKAALPELPDARYKRYTRDLGINPHSARLIYAYSNVCAFIDGVIALGGGVKNTVNLTVGTIFSTLPSEGDKEEFAIKVTAGEMAKLVKLLDGGFINVTMAQKTLASMLAEGKAVEAYISQSDTAKVDEGELEKICADALKANPKVKEDFKAGKEKAIFALFGYVKKQTGGRADMRKAEEILRKLLSE